MAQFVSKPVFRRSHALRHAKSLLGPDIAITSAALKGHMHELPKFAPKGAIVLSLDADVLRSQLEVRFVARHTHLSLRFDLRLDEMPSKIETALKGAFEVRANGVSAQRKWTHSEDVPTFAGQVFIAKAATGQANTAFTVGFCVNVPMIADAENTLRIALRHPNAALLLAPMAAQFDDRATRNAFVDDQPPTGTIDVATVQGIDLGLGDTVVRPSGERVMLSADGRLRVTESEPLEQVYFRSSVSNDLGDVGLGITDLGIDDR